MEVEFIMQDVFGNRFFYKDRAMKIPHRTTGPAVMLVGGNDLYMVDGKLHRLDGPAIELNDDNPHYFINGVEYSEADYIKHPDVQLF